MVIEIVRPTIGDLAILVRLNLMVQRLHSVWRPDLFRADVDPEALRAFWQERLSGGRHHVALAMRDGAGFGYLWCEEQEVAPSPFHHPCRRLMIQQIAVDPVSRRTGVGRLLLAHAENEALRRGLGQIILTTWMENEGAQAFFLAAGFRPRNMSLDKIVGDA